MYQILLSNTESRLLLAKPSLMFEQVWTQRNWSLLARQTLGVLKRIGWLRPSRFPVCWKNSPWQTHASCGNTCRDLKSFCLLWGTLCSARTQPYAMGSILFQKSCFSNKWFNSYLASTTEVMLFTHICIGFWRSCPQSVTLGSSITWDLVRNTNSQAPPKTCWYSGRGAQPPASTSPQGDTDAY